MTANSKLKLIRRSLGLTQHEFADKIGVSRCSVAYWETDRSNPNDTTLARIADILGYEPDRLRDDDSNGFITNRVPNMEFWVTVKMDTEMLVRADSKNDAINRTLEIIGEDLDQYVTASAKVKRR